MTSERTLPASDEAEQHILGCCLVDGAALDMTKRLKESGVTQSTFHSPANRSIYGAIMRVAEKEVEPDLFTVAEELTKEQVFEQAGGWPYLTQVATKSPTTAKASFYLERLLELATKREVIQSATAIIEHAYNGTSIAELEEQAKTLIPAPRTKTDWQSYRVTLSAKPAEPTVRLFLAGKPIATPGNLVTLISRAKTGKTATIGGVIAAIIGAHYDRHDIDTFGFTAPHTTEAVVLIDTEQSPFDAFTCHQRAFARANQEADISWLCHYAMVGCNAAKLRATLPAILAKASQDHKAVFTVILDGVADYVNSVNDEAECNEFIAWLRALAVQYNCPIICVIHSNEAVKAGDDGRGHLGKQLTRKAESNLLLKKVDNVTTITSEKQRKAPITEADGIAFQWSDELQRHVSCKSLPPSTARSGRRPKYDPDLMITAVPGPEAKPETVNAIHRTVGQLPCSIDIRTFKDWMAKWVETGEVVRSGDVKTGFFFKRSR